MLPFRNDNIDETNSSDGDASSVYYSNNEEAGDGEFLDARSESEWTSSTESSDDGSSVYFSSNEDAFIVQFNEPRRPEIEEVGDEEFVDARSDPEWTSSTDTPETAIATPTPETAIATPIDRSKFIAFVLLVFVGGVSIGYGITVPGGLIAMEVFLLRVSPKIFIEKVKAIEDNFCLYRKPPFLLYSGITPASGLIATATSMIYKRWGRRSVSFGASLLIIGSACSTWFPSLPVEVVGRIMTGFGVWLLYQIIPSLWAQLFVDDAQRIWSIRFAKFIALGSTLANLVNQVASKYHVWGFRMSSGIPGLLGLLILVLSLYISDSPSILVERGEGEKARQVLRDFRGVRGNDVETAYRDTVDIIVSERETNSFTEIRKRKNRRVLLITIVLTVLSSFLGVEILLFYGPYVLQSMGYPEEDAFLASSVLSVIDTASREVGYYVIRRFGRKKVYPVACLAAAASQILLFVFFHSLRIPYYHLPVDKGVGAAILVVITIIAYGVLPGPLDWLDSTFTPDCALLGTKITTCLNLACTFVISQVSFHLLCAAREWAFMIYAFNFLVLMSFIIGFVPETRGIKQEEMEERVWRQHWFWRHHLRIRLPRRTGN